MRELPLTRGYVALVDDEDYEIVSQYKWHASVRNGIAYAARRQFHLGDAYGHIVYMHRQLLQAPPDLHVDHRDGNGLNNTRTNIRLATRAQNMRNARPKENRSFKCVHFSQRSQKWVAMIRQRGQPATYIGMFLTPEEAARAYNAKATEMFGEFARLNVIPEVSDAA